MEFKNSPHRTALLPVLALLFTLVFTISAYTFLHESGHMLVGLFFGGKLTSFNIDFIGFTAHAGMEGQFAAWQRAFISIAGIGLPVILWTLFLLTRKQPPTENPVLTWLLFIGSMSTYSTLLAWGILPLLSMSGLDISDDSIGFLHATGFPPSLVSAVALAGWLAGLLLFIQRIGGIQGLRERFNDSLTWRRLSPAGFSTLRGMAFLLVFVLVSTFTINQFISPESIDQPPAGYALIFEASQAKSSKQADMVYRFTLDVPATVNFYFILRDFKNGPVELVLSGPVGYLLVFIRSEEKTQIGRATIHPEPILLEAGEYEIRLTAPRGPSILKGYMKTGS